jgi:hypothetical protein
MEILPNVWGSRRLSKQIVQERTKVKCVRRIEILRLLVSLEFEEALLILSCHATYIAKKVVLVWRIM